MLISLFNFLLFLNYYTNYVICQSCPKGWEEFQNSCYKFTRSPVKNIIRAEETCLLYNSHLISVNTLEEHLFVTNWLRNNDPIHRKWLTSGRDTGNNVWKWDSDRSDFTMITDLWLPVDENSVHRFDWALTTGKHSAYNFSQNANRWGLVRVNENQELPYICEIKREDLINAMVSEREIDYGITVVDKRQVPRGPVFTQEPKDAVFDLSGRSQLNYISIRCVAEGYPTPIYKWYKEEYVQNQLMSRHIDPLSDNRITQTDGTLTIYNPQQTQDRGKYHCTAENRFGIVISRTVQLSFGYIGEFTKKRSPDYGKEYWGKSISCDPPQHHPRVNYYWTRNAFPNFVEEDRRVFVSHDGNLYFSSLEKIDRANYSCNVQSVISSTGRTGPFFPLIVDPASSGQKLLFPNNFPKAFPEAPLAGDDVRLECMAYGYPVPSYNWSRSGVTDRLPENAYTTNHNRVLILPKVQVEDMGDYVCTVTSGRDVITKKVMLSIQSHPVFTIKLGNKVVEKGVTHPLVWTCEAFGIPEVYYQWFKNGVELKDRSLMDNSLSPEDRQRYIVKENILTIDGLIPDRDEGMYQCKAYNQLGSSFTSGQLKIISLAPSFRKHPLEIESYASDGGNVTIPCVPEAIPFPTFEWQREGSRIGGPVGRIRILPNGFLSINPVQMSDEGLYTCIARNELGFDRSQGYLRVFDRPRIYEGPSVSYERRVNETLDMPCSAITDPALDVAYIWKHNGLRINFTKMPQFSEGQYPGFLRLNNITFSEAGDYVCEVKTSVGKNSAPTRLLVSGPPSAPGAVLAEDLTSTSAKIHWSDGSENGRRIWAYMVEGRTNHNPNWLPIVNVSEYTNYQYFTDKNTGRRVANIMDVLSPWSSYEFRVSAINDLGIGPPSDPSPLYNTDKAVPFKAPSNVGGGGGKAGTLTITWDPLPPQDWNAPEVWYQISYRGAELRENDPYISKNLSTLGNTNMYAVNVGEDNYFKPYLVKVRAMNSMGSGRVSSHPVVVYSAESMPQVAPNQVYAVAFNSTALNVSWAPLEMTREKIRGRLIGHRIKYWPNNKDPLLDSLTLLNRKLDPWGLIVALVPDTEYYISVMAYNDAGSGPESEPFLARTYKAAPQRQPTSVNITALDSHSVMVTWRGITTLTNAEEPIIGYKVRYWESDQTISTAQEVYKYLDGGELKAIIPDLVPGKVYKLRVLAFSSGGDGKMSSQWEFKVGEGVPSHLTSSVNIYRTIGSNNWFIIIFTSIVLSFV